MREYLKNHYRLIFLSAVAALICFGFQAFRGNIGIDTEELINEPGTTLGWLSIGRFGLVLLKRVLGLSTHSVIKSGIFLMLFFVLGGNALTFGCYYFSGKNEKYPYWILLLLYMTSTIWSYQFYFSLQQAEVALAMLLLIIAAFLMMRTCVEKGSIVGSLTGAFFLVIGLGTYQALAVFYIAVCIAFFLVYFWRREKLDDTQEKRWTSLQIIGRIGILLLHFGIAYLIYQFIANTWFMSSGVYMEGQRAWGSIPAAECIKNILRMVRNLLRGYGPRSFSFYSISVVLTIATVIIVWKKRIFAQRMDAVIFLLGLLGMLATPFLMTIYAGTMLATRTQFGLPVAASFLAMFGIGILKMEYPRKKVIIKIGSALVIFAVMIQVGYQMRLHYADELRCNHDKALADEVVTALRNAGDGEIPDIPVLFVGYRAMEPDAVGRRSEMYGWSFFEWDYSVGNPTGATHRIDGFIQAYKGVKLNTEYSDDTKQLAVELAEDMSVFPEDGSIKIDDTVIIVKLSEVEANTNTDWW